MKCDECLPYACGLNLGSEDPEPDPEDSWAPSDEIVEDDDDDDDDEDEEPEDWEYDDEENVEEED